MPSMPAGPLKLASAVQAAPAKAPAPLPPASSKTT
jgi:hypothetical protein